MSKSFYVGCILKLLIGAFLTIAALNTASATTVKSSVIDLSSQLGEPRLKKSKHSSDDVLLGNIYFAYDSFKLTDTAKKQLDKIVKKIDKNAKLQINGHCDERGTVQYNYELGLKRASVTKQHLVALGFKANKITLKSFGEKKPVTTNKSAMSYRINRRAEIKIKK